MQRYGSGRLPCVSLCLWLSGICLDIVECDNETLCDVNAACMNTPGSFICSCDPGFTGDGFSCTSM